MYDATLLKLSGLKEKLDAAVSAPSSSVERAELIHEIVDVAYFSHKIHQYLEQKLHKNTHRDVFMAEAIIRPTGLIDPEILVKPVKNQVDDVLEQVRRRVLNGERVLITTLTKKFSEELDIYFKQLGIKSAYIHSEVDTLERLDILADLRRGVYDVLIGINLLREGLDLPEVSLVAIFDADKEGFLRSKTSLVQIIGRAARHEHGQVIMYADRITDSMRYAIDETNRRRELQMGYNTAHGIVPRSTVRNLETISDQVREDTGTELASDIQQPAAKEISSLEDMGVSGKNARGGRYRDRTGARTVDPLKYNAGQQVYANFNAEKEVQIQEILAATHFDPDALLIELDQAITAMNFERAAAIRDIIKAKK
jgi:excinuclease UvrABC helicase subunit UvrB